MSTRPPDDSPGPFDHLALRYLRQSLDMPHPVDEPYVLNPLESRVIRRTKVITLSAAALLGILGVILLYLPQYFWPFLFTTTPVRLFGNVHDLPLVTTLYGILLVYVEVNLLIELNAHGVKSIMRVCHFPNAHDAQYEQHLQSLTSAVFEKKSRGFLRFGLDPYLTIPRWGLTIFFLLNIIKAALSSLTVKFLLKRLMGRYALIRATNLVSMPIYAFWNAWASWQVLHEAQIRVMAPITIREFVHELHEEWGKNDQFRPLILEALHYIGVLQRQYNYAHSLLTETLINQFKLPADANITGHFPEQITHAPVAVRHSLERLIVFGTLIDGNLSWFEKRRLNKLRNKGFLTYSNAEIQRIGENYNDGRGLWV
jgi:hypothetical protein